MHNHLSSALLRRDLAIRDLSDPSVGPHAIQTLAHTAVNALVAEWRCDIRYERGPRVVSIADNYDALGFTTDAVSRDARYTRYVDDTRMLRSHSSAMIPAALRRLAFSPAPDVLLACPGIVYRRDSIDRIHTGTPHQMDLWRITDRRLDDTDMDQMISTLVGALAPGCAYRCESRIHPYTTNGRQVDVLWDGEWLEIAECGVVSQDVLGRAGLPSSHGLAIGVGLDRLLMLRKRIPDIRLLRSTDQRVSRQMLDLSVYRPVSSMPSVVRDLSVAVDIDDVDEDLGDRVRDSLGEEASVIEEVRVLTETSYSDLPEKARQRIGMSSTQKNVLVRVRLRPVDRTLSDSEANIIRDRIYEAIHRGTRAQWTALRG